MWLLRMAAQVCCTDAELDASLEWEGDAQGVRRLVQALEAHTWPGLVMKPRGGQVDAVAAGVGNGGDAAGTVGAEAEEESAPEHVEDRAAQAESALASLMGGMFSDEALLADGEDEEGLGMRELEAMMAKVAQQRERAAGLSDEERREQAARLAAEMMRVMGLEEE